MSLAPLGVVLVVDDSKDDRELLSSLLASSGYDVLAAASGAECLEMVENRRDHDRPLTAILVDLIMPLLNGFEVLQQLRKCAGLDAVPVIIMSPYDHPHHCPECLARGANAVLEKPVQREALLLSLDAAFETVRPNCRS